VRQRTVSSIGVVLVGLVPAILGGMTFVIAFMGLFILAFTELAAMMKVNSAAFRYLGGGLILLAGFLPVVQSDNDGLPLLLAALVMLPLVVAIFTRGQTVMDLWSRSSAASLYLAVPAFAAVSIRQLEGESSAWLVELDGVFFSGGSDTSLGLGWFLLVLFVTWLSDTGAYLVGKNVGRRKLLPRVSPNKTVEGAIGGLGFSALTGLLCSWLFKLEVQPWLAIVLGIVLGAAGMLGDLAESAIKRQLGVKDSGTLIPGHGGVLDRIDALLFALVTAWLIIPILS
jgi:phosphatidate cytidylyltransferase